MKITLNNYIEVFIDFFEGKLTSKEVEEMFHFLEHHPHLQNDFEQVEQLFLESIKEVNFDRTTILKDLNECNDIDDTNFEEICIAELEGDLYNPILRGKLYQVLNTNSTKNSIYKYYKNTFFKPHEEIVCPIKVQLLRKEKSKFKIKPLIYRSVSIAASLLFIVIMGQWLLQLKNKNIIIDSQLQFHKQNSITIILPSALQKRGIASSKIINSANKISSTGLSSFDTSNLKRELIPLENLTPKEEPVQAYFPYRDYILLDESNIIRVLTEDNPTPKRFIAVGNYIKDKIEFLGLNFKKLPEVPINNFSIDQINLMSSNRIIFRKNIDTTINRKQIEINFGLVDFYLSYSMK